MMKARLSPVAPTLQRLLGNLSAVAFISACTLVTAKATFVSADAITISPGEVLLANSLVAATDDPVPASGFVFDTVTITIAPGGLLDLQNNTLIVRAPNFPALYGYLTNGYDGGTWAGHSLTGGNINSSIAASDPTHLTAVGIVDNAEAHYATFKGVDVSAFTEALITYSYYGDANLDGDVNSVDLALFGTGSGWYHGDFNYSGTVDAADYELLNASFAALHPGEPIPEPGLGALVVIGALCLLGCRRRTSTLLV